jgi:hypothetical protein
VLAEGGGRVVIASSRADEVSLAGKPYSAFTLALLEALTGEGVSQRDGYVRASDLALHTREMVSQRTKGRQHPILDFTGAENFRVAYYAGGSIEPKGSPFPAAPEVEVQPGQWIAFSQPGWSVQSVTQIGGAANPITINIGSGSQKRDDPSNQEQKNELRLAIAEDVTSFIYYAKWTSEVVESLDELRARQAPSAEIQQREDQFHQLRSEVSRVFARVKRHFENVRLRYESGDVKRALEGFSAWWDELARTEGQVDDSPNSPGQVQLQALLEAMRKELRQ